MVSIEQAIEDLRKAELVGEGIIITEGEIIILLDALRDLRNATKRIVERLEEEKYKWEEKCNSCKRQGFYNNAIYAEGYADSFENAIEIVKAESN